MLLNLIHFACQIYEAFPQTSYINNAWDFIKIVLKLAAKNNAESELLSIIIGYLRFTFIAQII